MGAYARAAAVLLERQPDGAKLRAEAWAVVSEVLQGPNAEERRACIRHLLPALVSATGAQDAVPRLSDFVGALLDGSSRAELADALTLAVAFHAPLLDHWHAASPASRGSGLRERLIAAGLRRGLKEAGGSRKHARFLLEEAIRRALAEPDAAWLRAAGLELADAAVAWRGFGELLDALEASSSHLLKDSWDASAPLLASFLRRAGGAGGEDLGWPSLMPSPFWLQALLARALDHSNDAVQRFVLGKIVGLDLGVACLEEDFVLGEVLSRLNQNVELLYPRNDVDCVFERQVTAFFLAFIRGHADSGAAASRLLAALLALRAPHYTLLRLALPALEGEPGALGALGAGEVLAHMESFLAVTLGKAPVSVRPLLARLFLAAAEHLARPADEAGLAGAAASAAAAVAAVPDALLGNLRASLAGLVRRVLGPEAAGRTAGLLAAAGSEAALAGGEDAPPMVAVVPLTLGAVRVLWALGELGEEERLCGVLWGTLQPALRELGRTPAPPHAAEVVAVFGVSYGLVLLPGLSELLDCDAEVRRRVLDRAQAGLLAAMTPPEGRCGEEAPWTWLWALAFRRVWPAAGSMPSLPHAAAVAEATIAALRSPAEDAVACDEPTAALARVAAVTALSAVAALVETPQRRAETFLALWRARCRRVRGVEDERFGVGDSAAAAEAAAWKRSRLEEYEDLPRMEREGLGRVLEWRDVAEVFQAARWAGLASLAASAGLVDGLACCLDDAGLAGPTVLVLQPQVVTLNIYAQRRETLQAAPRTLAGLAREVLAELDVLPVLQVVHWAVVARHLAYPVALGHSAAGEEEEEEQEEEEERREAVRAVCSALSGLIAGSFRPGAASLPRGCLRALAAALCDPVLLEAQHRLSRGGSDPDFAPVGDAVRSLVALGATCVGVSRSVAVPLVAALCRPSAGDGAWAAPALVQLLLHSERTIADGPFSHAPEEVAADLPPALEERSRRFGCTPGFSRVVVLAALDGLRDAPAGAALAARVVQLLLDSLRARLEVPQKKGSRAAKSLPKPQEHLTQLRAWQALLVLASGAEEAAAAAILPELFAHLRVPAMPDVRDYQELLTCALGARFENLVLELLLPALREFDAPVQVSASLLVVASYLLRRRSLAPAAASGLLQALVPYLGSNCAYVRGVASWGFHHAFDAASAEEALLLAELHRFLATDARCGNMRDRLQPVFAGFDPGAPHYELEYPYSASFI